MNALVTAIAVASIVLGLLSVGAILLSELAWRNRSRRAQAKRLLETALEGDYKGRPLPFPSRHAPLDLIAAHAELTELAGRLVRPR